MKNLVILMLAGLCWNCADQSPSMYGRLEPGDLTCEYLENPDVVDVLKPRLSWINLTSEGIRGQSQSAYQIRVASSRTKLKRADLWASEKINSDHSVRVIYDGLPLNSRQECWWQVRVWDIEGHASNWSDPGSWRMGLLNPEDWQAKWIGAPWQGEEALPKPLGGPNARPEEFGPPAPLLRKDFSVEKEVSRAVAFVTGLGYFELYLNGEKVGKDMLVPNQTNYGKRPQLKDALISLPDDFRDYKVMYLAYDIRDDLNKGKNAVGAILGNGFYNPAKFWTASYGSPRFLCQIHLTYSDGTEEVIISDETWKASRSPILMDMVYYGEVYDARMEQPGWNSSGFDDSQWESVSLRNAPEGRLVAHTAHPDRIIETFKPLSIRKLDEGHYQVDFGVEISGWVRLHEVEGPAGQRIELKFNGNQYSGDNSYIFKGHGPESYAPRFNWFVFSGVEITNWPGELKPEHLIAEAVNTYIEPSACFITSNQLINDINKIWRRSQTDNMHGGIVSDCPHRERSGYTGDGQIACLTVLHNYDAKNFYHKWVQDMLGAQIAKTGYVPNGAPWQPGCGGGPAWGAAICIIPWHFYVHYGSLDMLSDNFEGMKGYVRYMLSWTDQDGIMHSRRTAKDGTILKWFNLGEWVPPGKFIPDDLVHTFYLWYCATITSSCASVLGLEGDAKHYEALALKTREAFQKKFYDKENGSYGDGGGNILALKMGVPANQYDKVIQSLREGIRKNNGHLDTGIIGTRFYFEILADNGLNDLAYEAMNKRTEPSYGRWLELGSTTTRERWDEGGSHNHPMFGGGLVWLYRNLAGMQADPEQPGYKHIIFRPQIVEDLDSVSYFNQTPYGQGGIAWTRDDEIFKMEISVPVSCSATVYVPVMDQSEIFEGDSPATEVTGVSFLRVENDYAVFGVQSGDYHFRVE